MNDELRMILRLKILNIKVVSTILKLFWLFPVKRKRVLFLSYGGKQFSDSPKAVYEDLYSKSNELELVWGFRNPQNLKGIQNLRFVKIPSFTFLYTFCTAKYIIVNDFFNTYLPVRKNQILIDTWHGGGWFKKVGLTNNNYSEYDKFFFSYMTKKITYFVASSEYFVDTVLHPSFNYQGKILRTGMPRNAIFFQDNKELRESIRGLFTQGKDALLVLYAPTFRNYDIPVDLEIDLNRLKKCLSQKFKKDVVILFRAHHLISEFPIDYSSILDVTSYPDMQQLLLACDILVSDYSSCMWDAAIQNKIVIVYAPDAQRYIDNRGFFLDIREWPFLLAFNNDQMEECILSYNKDKYLDRLQKLVKDSQSYENENSARAITNIILKCN